MGFVHGFKTKCEKASIEYRRVLSLKPHDRLPARDLAAHLGIKCFDPRELPTTKEEKESFSYVDSSEWSAFCMLNKCSEPVIVYNPGHSSKRTESDIMHEIGHVLCGHLQGTPPLNVSSILLRTYDQSKEDEAIWMGFTLMLPKDALLWCLKNGLTPEDISNRYEASSEAVRMRLNISGAKSHFSRIRFYQGNSK